MAQTSNQIAVYLEIGKKRTFAGAIDWPGWVRSGRDESAALQALYNYGPRYSRVLHIAKIDFQILADVSAFTVVERLEGNVSTDFGAPAIAPSSDTRSVDGTELQHFKALLEAYWQAFDATVNAARGRELRKGPRGGGRDLEGIVQHVISADAAYLRKLGWKFKQGKEDEAGKELRRTRQAILEALGPAVRGELPARGPRGGDRWAPRYFVRRVAWHVLDHAWEIEDRIR